MGGLCSKNNRLPDPKVHGQVQVSVNPYKSSSPLEEPVLQRMEKPESELNPDDFYDGIPRFTLKSRSVRSTQAAVAKVFPFISILPLSLNTIMNSFLVVFALYLQVKKALVLNFLFSLGL